MIRAALLAAALLLAAPAGAEPVQGRLEQGGLAVGQAAPGSTVTLDGRPVAVAADGRFLIGWGRDAGPSTDLVIQPPGQPPQHQTMAIAPRAWKEQSLKGLPEAMVTPDPVLAARIAEENARIAARRQQVTHGPAFAAGLVQPADGPISGVFGSRRILNGQPRAAHSGTDFAAPAGAPVLAAGSGTVTLAEDQVLTGNTVMIDHGLGLQTIYAHLSDRLVQPGQTVQRGQLIGHVGATGRATGPHLHFGASWLDVKLDPETVLAVLK